MNIALRIHQFQIDYVNFMKTRKNIVMENSLFIKLIYSDENLVMNSIFIEFPVKVRELSRNMIFYNMKDNDDLIQKFTEIESQILQSYQISTGCKKLPMNSLQLMLEKGNLKYNYISYPCHDSRKAVNKQIVKEKYVIKISGIWENADAFGINFKLFIIPFFVTV
jgi:hypothetical protein